MIERNDVERANPAARRVVRDVVGHDVGDALHERVSGSDLTSLLLDVMRRRAERRSHADIVRQYERDRFTRPAVIDPRTLLSMTASVIGSLGADFELVETAPLVPLGTHSVLGRISQNRVVSTIRSTEAAADPTNSLALEAAVRRRELRRSDPRSTETVRLAAVDRVTRAQQFDGPDSFAHFTLLGLVTAGRDTGHRRFETDALADHVRSLINVCRSCGFEDVEVALTALEPHDDDATEALLASVPPDGARLRAWPDRRAGRSYYEFACFKLGVVVEGDTVEVADGGLVDWTQSLLNDRKERLMISGLSIERLAQRARPTGDRF